MGWNIAGASKQKALEQRFENRKTKRREQDSEPQGDKRSI